MMVMPDLSGWELKITEEHRGDEVRLSFELYNNKSLVKKWGKVVRSDQLQPALDEAKRFAKEFALNYGTVKTYTISLSNV